MRIHELKILDHFFEDVISGKKTFEIRRNDRDFYVGDLLALNEVQKPDPTWASPEYTGRCCVVQVEYLLDDPQFLQPEYVAMAIRPCIVEPKSCAVEGLRPNALYSVPVL